MPCHDATYMVDFLPPITTDVAVGANSVNGLIEIIAQAAKTGKIGANKVINGRLGKARARRDVRKVYTTGRDGFPLRKFHASPDVDAVREHDGRRPWLYTKMNFDILNP